jgi:alpha-tubulin suppressor-like RCC1 family protein
MAALRSQLALLLGACAVLALVAFALLPRPERAHANPLTGIAKVSSGPAALTTCAVTTGGGVLCWGKHYGPIPATAAGVTSGAADVVVGHDHVCMLTTAGGVKCWGDNAFGKLGDGTFTSSTSPVSVVGLGSGVMAISVGDQHTCALLNTGAVRCWGQNDLGQLGNGNTMDSNSPVAVSGLAGGVSGIGLGALHSCAVLAVGGGVKCWGGNITGRLGDGTYTDSYTPVSALGVTNAVQVSGGVTDTCAVLSDGGVTCWGGGFGVTPTSVAGFPNAASSAGGNGFYCVQTGTSGVLCRGANGFGQLGDGQQCGSQCNTPVTPAGLAGGVTDSAVGYRHACAVLSAALKCWGSNDSGQLGDGTATNRSVPFDVVAASAKPTPTSTPCPPGGCPTPTRTPTPDPSAVDFSIGIDSTGDGNDECRTGTSTTKCVVSSGETFTARVYVDDNGGVVYLGLDITVTYAGVTSKDNANTDAWPECSYPAHAFDHPNKVIWGCGAANGSTSTYVGLIGENDFNCVGTSGSIALIHGDGNTNLTTDLVNFFEPEGTSETLTINCVTPTITPTPTNTPRPPALGGVAQRPNDGRGPGAAILVAVAFGAALTLAAAWRLATRRGHTA